MYARAVRLAGLVLAALTLSACEHDEVCNGAQCGRPGIESTFQTEDQFWREIAGRVRADTELVPSAIVHVDSEPGLGTDAQWTAGDAATITTNDFGFYRLTNAPLLYALTVRSGNDVLVMHDLTQRYFEPPLDATLAPRVFTAHVDVVADPPPPEGQSAAFFVSGTSAFDVHGSLAAGVDVRARSFSDPITLYVVTFDAARGLVAPIAFGKTDLNVQAQGATPAHVALAPVMGSGAQLVVIPQREPGVDDAGSELSMDFGVRTSARNLTIVNVSRVAAFGVVPGARYLMRTHGVKGAATSDSGLFAVDTSQNQISPILPAPPTLLAPVSNGAVQDGTGLEASTTKGILEHILVPAQSGAPTIRIVTRAGAAAVPDLASVGLAHPSGNYVWTVRRWPTVSFEDQFSGADFRVTQPSATSEPRVVVLP
jgi:hypothetical protein